MLANSKKLISVLFVFAVLVGLLLPPIPLILSTFVLDYYPVTALAFMFFWSVNDYDILERIGFVFVNVVLTFCILYAVVSAYRMTRKF